MVDAHCHLNDPMYAPQEIAGLVKAAEDASVTAIICDGADLKSSKLATQIAHQYKSVYATVGQHPEGGYEFNVEEFKKIIDDKVVAIGECGLDYLPETSEEEKIKQRELLLKNIQLAKDTKLPLVIHCRNAFADIFRLVDYETVQMHCFTGHQEEMDECAKRRWYLSFGGIATFKKSAYLRELIRQIPEDKLLIETDAPYLSPEPIRGERNSPANVKIVAELVANLRNCSINQIDELTTANAKRLFRI